MPQKSLRRRNELEKALKDPWFVSQRQWLVNKYLIQKAGIRNKELLAKKARELRDKLDEQFQAYVDWKKVMNSRKTKTTDIARETGVPSDTVKHWTRQSKVPYLLKHRPYAAIESGNPSFSYVAGLYTLNGLSYGVGYTSFSVESSTWHEAEKRISKLTKKNVYLRQGGLGWTIYRIYDPDLSLALYRATKNRSDLPAYVWVNDDLALEYLRGIFHAGGTYYRGKQTIAGEVRVDGINNSSLAEKLAVLMYKRLGVLPIKLAAKNGFALSLAHRQDIEAVSKEKKLREGQQVQVFERIEKALKHRK